MILQEINNLVIFRTNMIWENRIIISGSEDIIWFFGSGDELNG
jgi:hypothetical protein